MRASRFPLFFLLALTIAGFCAEVGAAPAHRIAAPVSHENLSVFLIHGKDEIEQKQLLTLQEAMQRGVLTVHETSSVNQLVVENTSADMEVFIQSGDIVKGGKQDRVLAVDILVPAGSGKLSIEAFCVESGRWQQRGNESAGKFSSSNDRIVSKDLKLAANKDRSQGEVWKKVAEAQGKLSSNVGASVNSDASATSLQLSLEHGRVVASVEEYVKALEGIVEHESDIVGYAFAINGKINSADVYASSAMFKKLWPKLLKASATEAVAELDAARAARPASVQDVEAFIASADQGRSEERAVTDRVKQVTRENTDDIVFEARDEKSKAVLHRSYVKKR